MNNSAAVIAVSPNSTPFIWTWQMSILSVILTLIITSSLTTNLFVIYTFTHLPRKTPASYGICNLAVADFLVSILVLPFLAVHQVTNHWYFGPTFCTIWICTHFTLCAASILSTLFICIERFIGVSYPLHHSRILSKGRIIKSLSVLWILAAIPSLIRVFILHEPVQDSSNSLTCKTTHNLANAIIASVVVLYIPSLIMVILYTRIFCIASFHLKGIELGLLNGPKGNDLKIRVHSFQEESRGRNHSNKSNHKKNSNEILGSSTQPEHTSLNKKTENINIKLNTAGAGSIDKERKPLSHKSVSIESNVMNNSTGIPHSHLLKQIRLAKKFSVLLVVILVGYVPYFTAILLQAVNFKFVREDVYRCLTWLRYLTSCVNPFIYAFAMPSFRLNLVRDSSRSTANISSKRQG